MHKWLFWKKEDPLREACRISSKLDALQESDPQYPKLQQQLKKKMDECDDRDWQAFNRASAIHKDFWTPLIIPKPSFNLFRATLAHIPKPILFNPKDKILCRFIRPDERIIEKWISANATFVIVNGQEKYLVDLNCAWMRKYNRGFYRLFPQMIQTLNYKWDSPNPIAPESSGGLVSSLIGAMVGMVVGTTILDAFNETDEAEDITQSPAITALITTALPPFDLDKVEGIIAYRSWNIANQNLQAGKHNWILYNNWILTGTVHTAPWKHLTFADKIPDEDNTNGLYAHKITLGNTSLTEGGDISGLVELKGKVVEHNDGIFRAEYAKILQIWLDAETVADDWNGNASKYIQGLHDNYPTVPVYVMTEAQRTQALMWVAVNNYLREGNKIPEGILNLGKQE